MGAGYIPCDLRTRSYRNSIPNSIINCMNCVINRDHSFLQYRQFWAEPQNLPVSTDCCGIQCWQVIRGQIRHFWPVSGSRRKLIRPTMCWKFAQWAMEFGKLPCRIWKNFPWKNVVPNDKYLRHFLSATHIMFRISLVFFLVWRKSPLTTTDRN